MLPRSAISFYFACRDHNATAKSFIIFTFCSSVPAFCWRILKPFTAVRVHCTPTRKLLSFYHLCFFCFFVAEQILNRRIPRAFVFRQLITPRDQKVGWFIENLAAFLTVVVFEQEPASRFHLLSCYDLTLIMSKGFVPLHSYMTATFSPQVIYDLFYIYKFLYLVLCVFIQGDLY